MAPAKGTCRRSQSSLRSAYGVLLPQVRRAGSGGFEYEALTGQGELGERRAAAAGGQVDLRQADAAAAAAGRARHLVRRLRRLGLHPLHRLRLEQLYVQQIGTCSTWREVVVPNVSCIRSMNVVCVQYVQVTAVHGDHVCVLVKCSPSLWMTFG